MDLNIARVAALQRNLLILGACIGWLFGNANGVAWGLGAASLLLFIMDA